MKIGDEVVTMFSGRNTRHTIVEVVYRRSQSGVMFIVEPHVIGSSGNGIDSSWFRPYEKEEKQQ